jgi:tripartite-type tricarboxylate transporter receptor subunit TctC
VWLKFYPACVLGLIALSSGFDMHAAAQVPYPSHAIRLLVGYPPGGGPDIVARLIGQYLSESFHQPVVIENHPGANGNIAGEAVAKAIPDGYTLLLTADSGVVINPHVYSSMAFDPLKDLDPISSIASNQYILSVNPKVPVSTLPEFVDYARKVDPPLSFASGGVGSKQDLAMELLMQRAGIKLLKVSFRGGTPALQSTIAGVTQVLFAGGESAGQFESGTIHGLAASGKQRSKRYPNLPTIGELYPGFDVGTWFGLFTAAATPDPIVALLRTKVQSLLARPDMVERMNVSGTLEPFILSPEQFSTLIREDDDKYGKLMTQLNIKLE